MSVSVQVSKLVLERPAKRPLPLDAAGVLEAATVSNARLSNHRRWNVGLDRCDCLASLRRSAPKRQGSRKSGCNVEHLHKFSKRKL